MSEGAKSFLQRWFVTTLGVLAAAQVVAGVQADSAPALLAASLLLGILNAVLRPILMVLALPLLLVTLGLFTFVINALLLYLVGSLVKGFHVTGFWPAFKASLLISFVSLVASLMIGKNKIAVRASAARRPSSSADKPDAGSGPVIDV